MVLSKADRGPGGQAAGQSVGTPVRRGVDTVRGEPGDDQASGADLLFLFNSLKLL